MFYVIGYAIIGIIVSCVVIKLIKDTNILGLGYEVEADGVAIICFALAAMMFWPILFVCLSIFLVYKLVSAIVDIFIKRR